MSGNLKRKGSPSLEEEGESSKRRFAETEDGQQDEAASRTQTTGDVDDEPGTHAESSGAAAAGGPTDDRAARFAALRARNLASRKDNLKETKSEAKRKATDTSQLTALNRKRDIAEHKLLKAETEEAGEDFERKRAWDWTIEESERWDKKLAKKERNKDNVAFRDYGQEANKVYKRQLGQMAKTAPEERMDAYQREKNAAIERAIRSGGLELVETADGELIAVDKDGTLHSTGDDPSLVNNKPDKAAVDRLVAEMKKAEDIRLKKRRDHRNHDKDDGSDVTYINDKNREFNNKLKRHYDRYTKEIRESFERGTRI